MSETIIATCERYPSLSIQDIGLRFTDGVLEVSSQAHLDRLRRLSEFGVTIPEGAVISRPKVSVRR